MSAAVRLARLVSGDFAERSRRYGFLVTLAFTVWGSTIFVPALDSGYTTVMIHGHRGVYDSAWVGAQITLLVNAFLGIAGFYLVKGAIDRDRRTGVGELLAATPLSRVGYTVSKMLSNLAVLASMVGVVVVCSAVLQWVRGEDRHIDPLALVLPHALVTLPFMALVAAIAVLFGVLPVLRGGWGNVVWFFAWSFIGVMPGMDRAHPDVVSADPMGMGTIMPGMIVAARRAFPAENITGQQVTLGIQIGGARGHPIVTYDYGGIEWTPETVAWRLLWLGLAFAIAALAALPFDRFANEGIGLGGLLRRGRRGVDDRERVEAAETPSEATSAAASFDTARLDAVPPRRRFDLPTLVRAETLVALKGYPRLWYAVGIGLSVAALFSPLRAVKLGIAPVMAIWPMFLWSALGTREVRHGTAELLFSAPRPLSRQLPATWLAGAMFGGTVSATYGLRLVLAGDAAGAITWLVGIAFVPALALACGVLTGSNMLFEALYLIWWYVAALNHVPAIDFTGATAVRGEFGTAAAYALTAVALLATAWLGRRRQLAR